MNLTDEYDEVYRGQILCWTSTMHTTVVDYAVEPSSKNRMEYLPVFPLNAAQGKEIFIQRDW